MDRYYLDEITPKKRITYRAYLSTAGADVLSRKIKKTDSKYFTFYLKLGFELGYTDFCKDYALSASV